MIINNLAIVVNTHSSMKDLWEMFVNEFEIYFPKQKIFFFSDKDSKFFFNHRVILYKKSDDFTSQYYNCLKKIKYPYLITLNEDYILYNHVKQNIIKNYINILKKNKSLSFIRFNKGSVNFTNNKYQSNLFFFNSSKRNLYSQCATLWKTKDLLKLYQDAPKSYIGIKKSFSLSGNTTLCAEDEIDKLARNRKIKGLYSFHNEKKIGHSNYDSYVFPYLQSVIIKGEWNFKEYSSQLKILFKKYKINQHSRKTFSSNYKDVVVSFLKKIGLKNEY